jgi:hypothetical protein
MATVANGYDGGILRFLTFGRALQFLVSGFFVFLSGPVFVHRAVIAWQGTRLNWIVAAIVNVALGLMWMCSIYAEMLRDQNADRSARDLCPACGYNLFANASGVCPECGVVVRASRLPG